MRIMIPAFPGADDFADNVSYTLRAMGHDVIMPPKMLDRSTKPLGRILHEMRRRSLPAMWTQAERWSVTVARHHRPDLILCLTQVLRAAVLEELKMIGVGRFAAWWGDSPANMPGLGLLSDGWTAIFIKDAAAVRKFQAVGLPASHLHEAMNPDWHRRAFSEVGDEVVVAGSYYAYRQILCERLSKRGVPLALYGPTPPRWALPAVRASHRGRYIVKAEKSRVFGAGLACLNTTSLSEGDSLNCRAFEIAGTCGLQLIEEKPAVADCFEPRREVLTYRSVDEIVSHLERARCEPAWAMSVREAGHRRAQAQHTYRHRLDTILKAVE